MSAESERWRPWGRQEGGVRNGLIAGLFCAVTLAVAGAIGLVTKQPWLFPSLAPTTILFFASPNQRSSRPVNAIVGHFIAIGVGYACYLAFGLAGSPPALVGGLTPAYVAAGALSVAFTTLILELIRLPHPPAGASTLLVSLGILAQPVALFDMAGAVVLITAIGWAFNLAIGRWRP